MTNVRALDGTLYAFQPGSSPLAVGKMAAILISCMCHCKVPGMRTFIFTNAMVLKNGSSIVAKVASQANEARN